MKIFLRQMIAIVRLSFIELLRRNDLYALLALALTLMIPLSMASPFGAGGAGRYLDEVALLLVWGFSLFIAVGAGSRLLPPEFANRTIYPLLAKPISRGRLLLGKYLGAMLSSSAAVLLFYFLFAGSVLLRGGTLSMALVEAVVLHILFVALAVAVSLLGSLIFTPSANLVLSAGMLTAMFFFGRRLPEYAQGVSSALAFVINAVYALAPHAEFFDMRMRVIHGHGPVDAVVMVIVCLYAVAYVAALLCVSTAIFRRKKV